MENFKSKITSRKFIAAITGVITGICMVIGGNASEGAATVIASIIGYLAAEGYVDGNRIRKELEDKDGQIRD